MSRIQRRTTPGRPTTPSRGNLAARGALAALFYVFLLQPDQPVTWARDKECKTKVTAL
jgi:hypothetical protein